MDQFLRAGVRVGECLPVPSHCSLGDQLGAVII